MAETGNEINDSAHENKSNRIYDVLQWKNPLTTIAVFLTLLTMEISLMLFSVISVLAYMGLTFLIVTTSLKLYLKITGESSRSNILQELMANDVSLTGSSSHQEMTYDFIVYIENGLRKLKCLLLIEDYFESLKLAMILYILTYIGARFNFMTICVTATFFTFTLPKVYKVYKNEIDGCYQMLKDKIVMTLTNVQEKLAGVPGVGALFRTSSSHIHSD